MNLIVRGSYSMYWYNAVIDRLVDLQKNLNKPYGTPLAGPLPHPSNLNPNQYRRCSFEYRQMWVRAQLISPSLGLSAACLARNASFHYFCLPNSKTIPILNRRNASSSVDVNSPTKLPLAARIVRGLPPALKPYAYLARLDKPVGSWLLYWPCGMPLKCYANITSLEYYPCSSTWACPAGPISFYARPLRRRRRRNARSRLHSERSLGQESR